MRGFGGNWAAIAACNSTPPVTGFSPASMDRPARSAVHWRSGKPYARSAWRCGWACTPGECEVLDGQVAGIAVAIGARVSARAAAGEVLVSQTVKDLVIGSGIGFDDHGLQELKGVPGEWRLYAVTS